MVSKPSPEKNPLEFHLAEVSGYSTWGGLLRSIRNNNNVGSQMSQLDVADALNKRLEAAGLSQLPRRAYGDLERGHGYPRFSDLEQIFCTFVLTFKVVFSDLEVMAYVHLARARMGEKRKQTRHIKQVSDADWETLLDTLFAISRSKPGRIHLVTETLSNAAPSSQPEVLPAEDPQLRRLRAIEKAFRTDIRHLLERETWVNRMLVYPEKDPQVKLVVVQGAQGIGKSHAQALLIRRLLGVREEDLQSAADHEALALLIERLERESDYYLVPYRFETGAEKRAEDYLDEYLATILSDLTSAKVSDETKQRPLEIRIDSLMAAIKSHEKKVILLLDGAECIFPQQAGQWSKSWAQFFEVFAREPHQATMYVMTRVWAGMEESQYIEQTDLPELSTSASIAIWQHSGFEDVTEDTLREVCIRCCGNNPQMMIMLIAQCKKRSFALARWETNGTLVQNGKKSANQERLEALLTQDTMFDLQTDAKSRLVLERALTSQISHQAKQMLECLACSPFGLPLSLLFEQFAHAEKAFFHELLGASAIDVGMLASRRAVLVPFIREAVLQSLISDGRLTGIQDRVTELYVYWLETVQDFRDDSEKSALIAEMIVRYIRQQQLLKAAELIINFGWLCALFGQINRVQRVFDEVVSTNRGKDTGNAYEAGRVLLSYHLMMTFGEKINLRERDKDFHMVRDLCLAGKIVLRPSVEISLAHYLTLKMIHEKRYQYACDFLDETFLRISAREEVMPEDRASYLHSKSHLLGQWSSYAVETNQPEEAKRLYGECVEILTEVIATYTIGLSHALPIQERHYQFKIAKAWNDLAYYSRMLGRLEDAERAIIECLELKDQKKANVPNSLAVSYGEYAKILAALGKYKDAETKSDKAVALLQPGSPSTPRNKGMLLVERAQICEIQGRMDEAYQLAQEALPLLSGDRNTYRFEANQLCARIQAIRESTVRYQLDSEWYHEYHSLTQYNDISKLEQAGPFSEEEERLWKEWFPYHHDPAVWERLARLVKQSRDREFKQSVSEGRLPSLWYPALDLDDIHTHKQRFLVLQERIEQAEKNVVVRRLYTRKIEEHLLHLRLAEATYKGDLDTIRTCNEALYGRISQKEMAIALRELFTMLLRAEKHPLANEAACTVLKQLKQWNLSAADFLHYEEAPIKKRDPAKVQMWSETHVSPRAIQHFYEEVLSEYGFTEWRIIPSANRDATSLDLDQCILYLPTGEDSSVLSVAGLLAEEVETHMLRSVAGKQSRLALLSSGTRDYLPVEEGLAIYAVDEMMEAQSLGQKAQTWIQTLAPGLAEGILTPPHSFESLFAFLSNVLLAGQIASGYYKTVESAKLVAQRMTFRRVMRTFRGVPDLTAAGVCNAKDRVYLQGYREVTSALAKYSIERLFVGSIGTNNLDDMEELHILQPAIQRRNLACDQNLFERITRLQKKDFSELKG